MPSDGDRRGVIVGLQIALMSLTCCSVAVRLFTRMHVLRHVGTDDVLIIIATFFALLSSISSCLATKWGLGLHFKDQTPAMVKPFQQMNLMGSTSYSASIMFIKMSLLFLYLRLSPGRGFRTFVYVMLFVSAAFGISSICGSVLQCRPISKLWIPTKPGSCIHVAEFYYVIAAINIITDIIIYVLPIHVLWNLHLPKRQRLGLIFLFSMGGLVVIASLIRLAMLKALLRTTDPTWADVSPVNWSTIELHAGIFVTCGPAFKAFLQRYVPRLLGSTAASSHPHHQGPHYGSFPLSSTVRDDGNGNKTVISAAARAKPSATESEEHIVLPCEGIMRKTCVHVNVGDSDASSAGNTEPGTAK